MKLKKVATVVALLAVTIPLTVLSARADFNDDFESYSQNLEARIYGGRASGRLNPAEYNRLQTLWTNIEGIKRQYRGRTPNPQERSTIMNSLMTLDRQLTNSLHDNQYSRYQYWDTSRNDWKPDWRSKISTLFPIGTGGVNYGDEIDAYQRNLQGRIEQGRSSGRLTGRELSRLNDRMRQVDLAQRDFRASGYNVWERNNLMSMLTDLDREIVTQLRDNEQSRYQYWNANNNSWSQQWWLGGGGGGTVVPVADGGNYDDEIDAYEWNLRDRMQRGAASGRLTQSELNRLQGQLDDFDRQQWKTRRGGWVSQGERNKLLTLLTNIDRNLTAQLRDNDQSRYQYWNASNNTWSKNWWSNMVTGNVAANTYDQEIEAYRRNIQNRLNTGRSSGKLTPAEYNRLNASYQQFDNLYNRYNKNSINSWERSALMNSLSNLDREIVGQLRDTDQSHYGQWNPNKQNWSQQWWRTGGAATNNRNDGRPNNWNDNNNNNNNWKNRNQQAAQQEAARLATEKAAREASERAAREAAEKASRQASERAAREAAEKAARDAADRDRSANNKGNDGRWGNRDNDGDNNRGNRGNRGRDRNNDNNSSNNNSNNSVNNPGNNSGNNNSGNDNQASDNNNNNNNDDNSRGRGRGRGRDRGNDNN